MAKRVQIVEPNIYEIRQEQARTALTIARKIDATVWVGDVNDTNFYLVIKNVDKVKQIQEQLTAESIQTMVEYRPICEDYILYLLDDVKEEKGGIDDDEHSEAETGF